jgi:hypothetical protein
MHLTLDQVSGLAPDAGAFAAAKKLAEPRVWSGLGQSADALWGECQGSALYQVRVSLADFAAKCSCPSRKFPCKHSLGLLLLAAGDAGRVPAAPAPDWVTEWLAKRNESAQRKQEKAARPEAPLDAAAQAKRAEKRAGRIQQGLDALDLFMNDLVKNGLAALDGRASTVFEAQAARLVDAQAPGLAARLRQIGRLSHSRSDWAERVLEELGRLALLSHAARRMAELAPPLAADVRQALGFTLEKDEVVAAGDVVDDEWAIVGQVVDDSERVRVQRTWLRGLGSARDALVLQFAAGPGAFGDLLVPGTGFRGPLAFWPGAAPLRALPHGSRGDPWPLEPPLPGRRTVGEHLAAHAALLGRQPWVDRAPCLLGGVVPVLADADAGHWAVLDSAGDALELGGHSHWALFAMSGGASVDLFGEWDGRVLDPLGVMVEGRFHPLAKEAP